MNDFASDASGRMHKWFQVQVKLRPLIEINLIPDGNLFFIPIPAQHAGLILIHWKYTVGRNNSWNLGPLKPPPAD